MTLPEFIPHPDPSDQATALEMEALEHTLAAFRKRTKRSQEKQADGTYAITECVECGNEIGEGRLDAAIKNTICIECANAQERRR